MMNKSEIKSIRIHRNIFLPTPPALQLAVVEQLPDNRPFDPKNYTYLPHTHTFQELVVVTEGAGIQWINGQEFPVLRGDVFFLDGDLSLCFKPPCTMHLYNILFIQDKLPLPYNLLQKMPGYQFFFHTLPSLGNKRYRYGVHLPPEKIDHLIRHISALSKDLQDCRTGYEAKAILHLLEILVDISEYAIDKVADEDGFLSRISLALSKMEQDFARDWKIKELADIVYTSPRNFLRLFSKVTGTSPIAYLLHLKLTRAGEYLTRGIGIAETAQLCGFHDVSYFGKQFKKFYGISPRFYACRHVAK